MAKYCDVDIGYDAPFGDNFFIKSPIALSVYVSDKDGDPVDLAFSSVEARYQRYNENTIPPQKEGSWQQATVSQGQSLSSVMFTPDEPGLYVVTVQVRQEYEGSETVVLTVLDREIEEWTHLAEIDTTPPLEATSFTVALVDNEPQLSWTLPVDPDRFRISVERNGTEIALLGKDAVEYTDDDPLVGGTYTYRLRTVDEEGNKSTGLTDSVTILDVTAPPAITDLSASINPNNFPRLVWSDPVASDLAGIYIYRDGVRINNDEAVDPGVEVFIDDTAEDDTAYAYTVRGFDSSGNLADPSNTANITTNDLTAPSVPTNVQSTVTATTQVDVLITWDAVGGDVDEYKVYRDGTEIATVSAPTTQYNDQDLAGFTAFTWYVTAVDAADNESGPSTSTGVTTPDITDPTAPTNLVRSTADGKVNLAWTGSTDASPGSGLDAYVIYRGQSPNPTTAIAAVPAPSTTYEDTGLTNGTTYYYRVVARDNAGNASGYSNEVTATPVGDDPPSVSFTGEPYSVADGGNFTVTFDASDEQSIPLGNVVAELIEDAGTGTILSPDSGPTLVSGTSTNGSYEATWNSLPERAQDYQVRITVSDEPQGQVSSITSPLVVETLPPAPSNAAGISPSETAIVFEFDEPGVTSDVANYGYTLTEGGGGPQVDSGQIAVGTSYYVATGLSADTDYDFEVYSVDAVGNESTKATVSVSTLAQDITTVVSPTSVLPGGAVNISAVFGGGSNWRLEPLSQTDETLDPDAGEWFPHPTQHTTDASGTNWQSTWYAPEYDETFYWLHRLVYIPSGDKFYTDYATVSTDGTAPTITSGPTTQNALAKTFDLAVTSSEDGEVEWMVVNDDETAPTTQQVIDGVYGDGTTVYNGGSTSVNASVEEVVTLGGLPTLQLGTAYDVWIVLEDDLGNATSPVKADVTLPSGITSVILGESGGNITFSITSDLRLGSDLADFAATIDDPDTVDRYSADETDISETDNGNGTWTYDLVTTLAYDEGGTWTLSIDDFITAADNNIGNNDLGSGLTDTYDFSSYNNAETAPHISRVETAGGFVRDDTFVDDHYTELKNRGWLANLNWAWAPELGLNINDEATSWDPGNTNNSSVLFDTSGNDNDFSIGNTSFMPTLIEDSEFGNRLVLQFDGADDEIISPNYDSGANLARIIVTEHAATNGFETYSYRDDGTRAIYEKHNNDRLRIDIDTDAGSNDLSHGNNPSYANGEVYVKGFRVDDTGDLRFLEGGNEVGSKTLNNLGTGIAMTGVDTNVKPLDAQRIAYYMELNTFPADADMNSFISWLMTYFSITS